MTWNWPYVAQIMPALLAGVWETVLVTMACAVIAIGGGLVLAVVSSLAGRPGRLLVRGVVDFFRGVPILVALYFGYYALPQLGVTLPAFFVGVLVLGVIYAAYCSEVYRGALQSIPAGMHDAGAALGLSTAVMWRKVLIPLAVRRSVPALVNYVLVLCRQSAFLFAIGVPVLLARAQVAGYQSFRYLEPYTLTGMLYLMLNVPFVYILHRYEARHAHIAV
jgi:polar amino acid transport system permease protein